MLPLHQEREIDQLLYMIFNLSLINDVRTYLKKQHVALIWDSKSKCVELTVRARLPEIKYGVHDKTTFDLEWALVMERTKGCSKQCAETCTGR